MLYFNKFFPKQNILNEGGDAGASNGSGGSGQSGNASSDTSANAGGNASNTGNQSTGGVDWSKWAEALPEDIKKDPGLSTFKTLPDLAKGYINLQKTLGKDKVSIPDPKHATQADWLAVYQKLGAPSKAEDLKFNFPEGVNEKEVDAEFLKEIKEAAVSVGLTPWQFEKVFGTYHAAATKRMQANDSEFENVRKTDIDNLKKEWGQAYETQVKKANTAFMEFLKPEERQRLIDDGLAGHPSVVKILANAAKLLSQDKFIGHGDGENAGMSPAEAEKRAKDIMGNPQHPYRNPQHPNHKAAKEEVAGLWKIAYPG